MRVLLCACVRVCVHAWQPRSLVSNLMVFAQPQAGNDDLADLATESLRTAFKKVSARARACVVFQQTASVSFLLNP